MSAVQQPEMTLAARRRKFNRQAGEIEAAHTKAVEAAEKLYAEATADAEAEYNEAVKEFRAEFDRAVKPFQAQFDKSIAEARQKYEADMQALLKEVGFVG